MPGRRLLDDGLNVLRGADALLLRAENGILATRALFAPQEEYEALGLAHAPPARRRSPTRGATFALQRRTLQRLLLTSPRRRPSRRLPSLLPKERPPS